MARLAVESVRLTDEFAALCGAHDSPVPWSTQPHSPGAVFDALGFCILTVDTDMNQDGQRALADIVVLAVNTCGGFKAVAAEPST
jgi:hypothetical protein